MQILEILCSIPLSLLAICRGSTVFESSDVALVEVRLWFPLCPAS